MEIAMNTTMKTLACAAAVTAFAGAPFAIAQQQKSDQRQKTQERTPETVVRTVTFELMLNRSSELMGTDIYNARGEKLGSVADFVVSRRTGQIDSTLVNTGAILGVGGKEVRVPYNTLTWNSAEKRLETTMSKSAVDAMPSFDRKRAGDLPLDNINQYDRMENGEDRNANDAVHGGPYAADRGILLSTIVGHDLNCLTTACGEIEDTIIEVNTGRVVYLVIDPDENFLGIADTLRMAPFSIARWNVDASDMQVDATKEQILAAPEFDGDLLPFTSRARITEVYRVYGEEAPALDRRASDTTNMRESKTPAHDESMKQEMKEMNEKMKDKMSSGNHPD
jgi:sporulation protein YlmC with PRC-barrel domain